MIEITDGFTSITAGADTIEAPPWSDAAQPRTRRRRAPTGVRVTLNFSRDAELPRDQPVRVRYEFGDGTLRETVGIAKPTHVDVHCGRLVNYHYRLSYWIAPGARSSVAADNVRQRTERGEKAAARFRATIIAHRMRALMGTAEAEADRAHCQLIAIVAHELRYPLVPIRNAAALLQLDVVDTATIRRSAGIIERQVRNMHRLIGDLVDVSRMQRGALEIRRARAPSATLVECAIESAQPFANERGHTLTVSVSKEPVYLHMDLLRLSQAVVNIIANATKYTDGHGNIHVRAHRAGTQAIIMVSDKGIGIAVSELDAIFGLFTKSDQGMRVQQGLGIGLYLARHFIEAHGGAVTAASAGPGRGSDFTIQLPCEAPPAGRVASGGEEPRGDLIRA